MRFEVAENDRDPVALGKAVDLLVEHALDIGADSFVALVASCGELCHMSLMSAPPGCGRAGAGRRAKGHLMEPRTEGIVNPEVAGLLDQDEERGLEGVLRVVGVDKLGTANAQNHRAVALDDRLECQFGHFAGAGRKPLK